MNQVSNWYCNIMKKDNKIYLLPHINLQPYIAHYTFAYPADRHLPEFLTLIPDISGCIVLTFTGYDLECCFFGPSTKVITVPNQPLAVPLMIFIEFLPGGASQLFHLDQSELADQIIGLEDISNQLKNALSDLVYHYLDHPESVRLISEALDSLFYTYITNNHTSGTLSEILTYLHHNKEITSVKDLSKASLYSERHLNRLFHSTIGANTKSYLKLLRINQAVKAFRGNLQSLTDLAHYCGYYDQSHFNRDFKSVCGVTPGEFRLNMSEFYNENLKF